VVFDPADTRAARWDAVPASTGPEKPAAPPPTGTDGEPPSNARGTATGEGRG
jgi:hypothetical protein